MVEDTTISRNTALDGGGIMNRPTPLSRVVDSTLWDNRARNAGGGFNHESDADTEIENTTMSGNPALVNGGGLFVDADGGLRVINSTITQNRAPAGSGVGKPIESVNFPIEPEPGRDLPQHDRRRQPAVDATATRPGRSEGGNLDGGDGLLLRAAPATAPTSIRSSTRWPTTAARR